VLSGKLPADASKYVKFKSFEKILNDLLRTCYAPEKEREELYRTIERKARKLRKTVVASEDF